ncbi:putative F-box domain-containing protein [Helianthus annuus]|nr:putative F-box domain-containing protein [Helianthus annuus]
MFIFFSFHFLQTLEHEINLYIFLSLSFFSLLNFLSFLSFSKLGNTKISIPSEIMEDIFSRLPIESILRFRSLSKPWLLRLSSPSFTKLHSTRAHRTSLIISAYDCSARKQHLLSAPLDGEPVTHFMTLDDVDVTDITEAHHFYGLVSFALVKYSSRGEYYYHQIFVVNPSTHNIFKIPDPDPDFSKYPLQGCYLFGFDESKNEHKILIITGIFESGTLEILIYSMSNYSWRKIDVEPPIGFHRGSLVLGFRGDYINVCVNSVVYLLLLDTCDILGFDLRTEKFLIINTPQGVIDHKVQSHFHPDLIKINGCIGVVCHDDDHVLEKNGMNIWVLQDYENRVWVREIIIFPESLIKLGCPFPMNSVNMDEIIFSFSKLSGNVLNVHVYNRKSRCFKSVQLTPGHQFLLSRTFRLQHISCYVERMVPL